MSRRLLVSLGLAVATLSACKQDDPPPPLGNIEQPAATAIVDDRLFVTSLTQDGLRVVDLAGRVGGRCVTVDDCPSNYDCTTDPTGADTEPVCVSRSDGFVRAPNPLFALDVPTVRQPGALLALEANDSRARPLVVSLASADPQLRVVDAAGLLSLGDPVALPGRPVAVAEGPEADLLLVAVEAPVGDAAGSAGGLVLVRLDAAVLGTGAVTGAAGVVEMTVGLDAVPGGVAFGFGTSSAQAWVSDRAAPRVLVVNLADNSVVEVESPVILGPLATSPFHDGAALERGHYVFGVGREARAFAAFDTLLGRAADGLFFGGAPAALPLPGPPIALTTARDALVDVSESDGDGGTVVRTRTLELEVLVTLSDGRMVPIDGLALEVVDRFGRSRPEPTVSYSPPFSEASAPVLAVDSSGAPLVSTNPGVTRSRTWSLTFGGPIPGLVDVDGTLAEDGGAVRLTLDSAPAALADRLLVGDTVELLGVLPPDGCTDDLTGTYEVASVATGSLTLSAVTDGPALPGAPCLPATVRFDAMASGVVVTATRLELVRRAEPGVPFVHAGSRFLSTDPLVDAPALAFTLADPQPALSAGATRSLVVDSGQSALTLSVEVDTTIAGRPAIPGAPSVHENGENGARVYLPFAGSGYVATVDPRAGTTEALLQ